jgi:hypothetical protein
MKTVIGQKKMLYGEVVSLAKDCFLIRGRQFHPLRGSSSSSVLIYKHGSTVSIVDSGAGAFMKEKIFLTVNSLRPFTHLVLYVTQASPEHAANNSILGVIEAPDKKLFVSPAVCAELKNLTRLKTDSIRDASHYIEMHEYPNDILETLFKHYAPLEGFSEKAQVLDESKKETFVYGSAVFHGWKHPESGLTLIETEAFGPGALMVFIDELKLLFTGGETAAFFPLWAKGSDYRQRAVLNGIKKMVEAKAVTILIGSHPEQIFFNRADSISFIEELADRANRFDAYLRKNLEGHAREGGATLDQLYLSLKAGPFGQFLPHWDIEAKIVILHKLRSLGCHYRPEEGLNAQFKLSIE